MVKVVRKSGVAVIIVGSFFSHDLFLQLFFLLLLT